MISSWSETGAPLCILRVPLGARRQVLREYLLHIKKKRSGKGWEERGLFSQAREQDKLGYQQVMISRGLWWKGETGKEMSLTSFPELTLTTVRVSYLLTSWGSPTTENQTT